MYVEPYYERPLGQDKDKATLAFARCESLKFESDADFISFLVFKRKRGPNSMIFFSAFVRRALRHVFLTPLPHDVELLEQMRCKDISFLLQSQETLLESNSRFASQPCRTLPE